MYTAKSFMVVNILMVLLMSAFCCPVLGAKKLTRQVTRPFTPADMKHVAKEITLVKDGKANAVALIPDDGQAKKVLPEALALLKDMLGVEFPQIEESNLSKLEPGMAILVFGDSNMLGIRLRANWLTESGNSFEIRGIPDTLDLERGVVYFGGNTGENILTSTHKFCEKVKSGAIVVNVSGMTKTLPVFSVTPARESGEKSNRSPEEDVAAAKDRYKQLPSKTNETTLYVLAALGREYYRTGDERLPAAFMEIVRIVNKGYDAAKNYSIHRPPPINSLVAMVMGCDLVEESPSLTAKDRLFMGEVVRMMTEDCMNYDEMRPPMQLYAEDKTGYLVNHITFISRSVNVAARWLKSRFKINDAADYWLAVSAQTFKGMQKAGIGPEDAGGYQFISPTHFINFATESGQLDYKTPNLRKEIDYAAGVCDERGYTAGFGDQSPMDNCYGKNFLLLGYELYGEELYAWLLKNRAYQGAETLRDVKRALPENLNPGTRLLGLTLFEFDSFLKHRYQMDEFLTDYTGILKLSFRSGWGDNEQYLLLGGHNGGYHGHYDGNAIINFGEGVRYWLIDGDYIRAFPRNHSSLEVSCDNEASDLQRTSEAPRADRVAVLLGSASHPSFRQAVSISRLRDYGGTDWTRFLFWDKDAGLGVIDLVQAKKAGRYQTRLGFHTLGEVTGHGDSLTITQKPSEKSPKNIMYIRKADESIPSLLEQFEVGHGGIFGYWDAYEFSDPITKVISSTQRADLRAGQTQTYATFFQTAQPADAQPVFTRMAENAWRLDGRQQALLVAGKFSSGGIVIDADAVYLTDKRLSACGARKITFAGVEWNGNEASFTADFTGKGEGLSALTPEKAVEAIKAVTLFNSQELKARSSDDMADLKEITPVAVAEGGSTIRSLAVSGDTFATGGEDGLVTYFSANGEKIWQASLGLPVTALAPIQISEKIHWAAGTRYNDRKNQIARLVLISPDGEMLWTKEIGPYRGRPGTVRCITSAKLQKGQDEQIVVGTERWYYYAYDAKGEQLWEYVIDHAATVVDTADLNSDGLDEVMAGTEYGQTWLLNAQGTLIKRLLPSSGAWSAASGDLAGDGRPKSVFGYEDSFIRMIHLEEGMEFTWQCNVGGLPTGISFLPQDAKGRLAVSTDMGTMVFVGSDGKKTGAIEFPDAIDASTFDGKMISALCRNGRIYCVSVSGEMVLKSASLPPQSKAQGSFIATLAGGNTVVARADKVLIFKCY